MANEIRVQLSLSVANGSQAYTGRPTSFLADQSTVGGPSPGYMDVPDGGTVVNLSALVRPGMCRIMNLDPSASLYWGVKDPTTGKVYLPGKLLPGEIALLRLSEFVQEELSGTGTHELTALVRLFLTAGDAVSCKALVEAFET